VGPEVAASYRGVVRREAVAASYPVVDPEAVVASYPEVVASLVDRPLAIFVVERIRRD
jgi:hypothetical protein|tara:strand:- start:881 stop:1054 length:174 start_codon:yes stop_codon:yes gene_type:complete